MKRLFSVILTVLILISLSSCKKQESQNENSNTSSNVSSVTSATEEVSDYSLVAGIWQITSSTVDDKKVNVKKYKNILTYLYNDGTIDVKGDKVKTASGTYSFKGNIVITIINNNTSIMTLSEDYTKMTATGMNNGKKVVTTYTKISN